MNDTEDTMQNDEEEIVSDEEIEHSATALKKLRERLRVCEAEKQEYLLGWQRAKADFVNARKVEEKEREEFTKYSKEGVLRDFLTVADSFDMAFGHKESWEKVDKGWRTGVESIYSQLVSLFERHGLTKVGKIGDRFDPREHIPVGVVETSNRNEDETIADVVQNGYSLNGKNIRPAKVRVMHYEETRAN